MAVRETGVCRHHGGTIKGPHETPRTAQHIWDRGAFKEGPEALIMLRNALVSQTTDVRFSSLGLPNIKLCLH